MFCDHRAASNSSWRVSVQVTESIRVFVCVPSCTCVCVRSCMCSPVSLSMYVQVKQRARHICVDNVYSHVHMCVWKYLIWSRATHRQNHFNGPVSLKVYVMLRMWMWGSWFFCSTKTHGSVKSLSLLDKNGDRIFGSKKTVYLNPSCRLWQQHYLKDILPFLFIFALNV